MGTKPVVIGVSGGSGSGKSSVSSRILETFEGLSVMLLQQDYYYKNQSYCTQEKILKTNYVHSLAFDNDLFYNHLVTLTECSSIEKTIYDFTNHNRINETEYEVTREVIIVEVILLLHDKRIRDL